MHASGLSLYDINRLQRPKANGEDVSWENLNLQVGARLKALNASGKEVALITQTFSSPTTEKIIADFKTKYPNVKHVYFDTVASADAVDAFEATYGERGLADYDFSKAETIVSVGADILGDWQGGGYDSGYSQSRVPQKDYGNTKMSYHLHFESNMTLSGANADHRIPTDPPTQKKIVAQIYAQLTATSLANDLSPQVKKAVAQAIERLKKSGSKGVVVSGIEDVDVQEVILAINDYLGSAVIDVAQPKFIRQGSNKALQQLIDDMEIKEGGLFKISYLRKDVDR